jgi:hypothetical protein
VRTSKSYLISLIAFLLIAGTSTYVAAQSIFLQPGVTEITTGVGTEFNLELRVDAAITSLKSFVYHLDFDPAKLDTVSVTQGPLLPSSGASTAFGCYIVHDTVLQIEDLILGAGIDVSGPGLLATVRFRVLDTGTVTLAVINHRVRDVDGNLLQTQAVGGVVHINVLPASFNLLSPIGGGIAHALPGENLRLSWQASSSVYPGESVRYTLQYGTSPTFAAGATTTVTGLSNNYYDIAIAAPPAWNEGHYYWRVTAIGMDHGFQRPSTPVSEHFEFEYTQVPPEAFALLTPISMVDVSGLPGDPVVFQWQAAASRVPSDQVSYRLEYSPSSSFPSGSTDVINNLTATSVSVDIADFVWAYEGVYYWRVTATGSVTGLSRTGNPSPAAFDFSYNHIPPEPFNLLTPANGGSVSTSQLFAYFDWQDAQSVIPGDNITYRFVLSSDPTVQTGLLSTGQVSISEAYVSQPGPPPGIPRNQPLYWQVTALSAYGSTRLSSIFTVTFSGCCSDRVGDVNNSGDDEPTIGDISLLIDAKFISGNCDGIACMQEADVNQSGGVEPVCDDISIGDISQLIDYLFITGSSLGLNDCL